MNKLEKSLLSKNQTWLDSPVRVTEQSWPDETVPVISILCVAYNHEKYIEECINGLLKQETKFPVEIIIHDDASIDRTPDIIKSYCDKYPALFKPILQEENQYSKGRKIITITYPVAAGSYIAICEGDDYWSSPKKLQVQVDLLESHPDYVSCFHWADWLVQDTGKIAPWKYGPPYLKSFYILNDILKDRNFIPTCSVVFRNHIIKQFPDWYNEVPIGDLPLHMLLAKYGKIGFIDEKMGVCRRHKGGIYGGKSQYNRLKISLSSFLFTAKNMKLIKEDSFKSGISKLYYELTVACLNEKKLFKGMIYGIKSVSKVRKGDKRKALLKIKKASLVYIMKNM